jgi:hypothetical protein
MRSLLCTLAVLGTASIAAAGEIRVPEDAATIQAAVDAAAAGDVVVVGPGVYHESVVAAKSGITLEGRGAVWDGGEGDAAGPCLSLTGDANVVAGFRFVNGTDQCVLDGDGVTVEHCRSADAAGSFCVITGDDATVGKCRILDCGGSGVHLEGSGATVAQVKVVSSGEAGIAIVGDGAEVLKCHVRKGADGGVSVEGSAATVSGCQITATGSFGVSLDGDASAVLRNRAIRCGSAGGAGFVVVGADNRIEANVAVKCVDDGFSVDGDGNECVRDRAVNCEDDGFDVQGGIGVTLTGCVAVRSGGSGVENGGTGTDASRCVFVANQTDVALDGSLGAAYDEFARVNFKSGSTTTIVLGD